ncbi:hypothetical protein Cgig2_025890 [Carnegiea gigantea]|uniref:Zinc knuckle CX2CX4HX4C domain-containing protein n=1 Tax=Carnegiea gigantea TaxID=171969 RepID=A0A9Q1K609_9CARY|nr:hypothetical protein Cgig2_025890 [Carnegiea gigantea]
MYGVDKSLCFRVDIDITKPLIRGTGILIDKKPLWIRIGYVKLQDFCYGCGRLDHVYLGCDSYNSVGNESLLQYREWLQASPLKYQRRSPEAELREEKKLYLAFKNSNGSSKAKVKLRFDQLTTLQVLAPMPILNPSSEPPSQMLIDAVTHVDSDISDHLPIYLNCKPRAYIRCNRKQCF